MGHVFAPRKLKQRSTSTGSTVPNVTFCTSNFAKTLLRTYHTGMYFREKFQYEIQEQKEVPLWYTGPFRALDYVTKFKFKKIAWTPTF
jgi:hypothetical protein